MKVGDSVKLITFNGKAYSGKKVFPDEDYWKLIGHTGIVQKDPQEPTIYASFSRRKRVLVKFYVDLVGDFGLIAHNNVENSLWILESDIEVISD